MVYFGCNAANETARLFGSYTGEWTMADSNGGRDQKYGAKNINFTEVGGDIVIKIDTKAMCYAKDGSPCLAGSPNPTPKDPDKTRIEDLISTSGGFTRISGLKVSVNVTRP